MYKLIRIHRQSGQRYVVCVSPCFNIIIGALDHDMDNYTDEGLVSLRWEVSYDPEFDLKL